MKKTLMVLLMSCFALATIAQKPAIVASDKQGWHKLGSTVVSFSKDRDTYVIMGNDKFSALKFKVMDAGIDLQDLEVYYHNDGKGEMKSDAASDKGDKAEATATAKTNSDGSVSADVKTDSDKMGADNSMKNREDIQVRTPIMAGEESRVIDLKGGSRELKKVVFTYKTLENQKSERATVELWGLK